MIVIPDTSALVELIKGTEKGKAILNDVGIVKTIADMGLVVPLDREVAISAGKLHAEIRKKNKNKHVFLADCIISETARKYGALVVTTDHHFRLLGDAIIIES